MIKLSLYETFNNYINHVYNKVQTKLTTYNDDFKPTNIYFIRHGHSCSNLLKEKLKIKNTNKNPKDYADYKIKSKSLTNKFISSLAKKHTLITNPNLSGLGLLQAQELNTSVSAMFNGNTNNQLIVFCSPLVRAMETAQIAFPNRTISYEYYYFNNDSINKLPKLGTNKIYILPFIKELGITPDNALPNIDNSINKFKKFMKKYKNTATDTHDYNTDVLVNNKQETKVKKLGLLTKKMFLFFSRTKKKPSSSSNKNTTPLLNTQKGKFLSFLKKVNTSDISDTYKLIFVSHSNFIKSIVGKENITTPNNKIKNTMIIDIHGNNYSNKITDNSENKYMTCMSDTELAEPEIASASATNTEELAIQPKAKLNSSASRKSIKSQPKIQPLIPQSPPNTNSNATSSASSSQSLLSSYVMSSSQSTSLPSVPLPPSVIKSRASSRASLPPAKPPSVTKSSASSRASSTASSTEPLNNNKLKTNINSLFKTKIGQPNKINNVSIELGSDELILKYGTESSTIKYDKLSILNPMSKYIIEKHIGSDPNTARFVNKGINMINKSKIFYKVLKYLKDKNGGTRKKHRIKHKKTKKL